MFFVSTFNMVSEHDIDQTLDNTTRDRNQTDELAASISVVVVIVVVVDVQIIVAMDE